MYDVGVGDEVSVGEKVSRTVGTDVTAVVGDDVSDVGVGAVVGCDVVMDPEVQLASTLTPMAAAVACIVAVKDPSSAEPTSCPDKLS